MIASPPKQTVPSQKTNPRNNSVSNLLKSTQLWRGLALILFAIIIITQVFDIEITPKFSSSVGKPKQTADQTTTGEIDVSALQLEVIPSEGVELPIAWGDLGKQMIEDGVIDEEKFRSLFKGGLSADEEKILAGNWNKPIVLTQQNSRFLLDILWAFGLSNKSEILENGEMTDEKYGGDASKFAATGGWSLSKGDTMDHYSKHQYTNLTIKQKDLVDRVSRNIYRPCCGNSTHFPDCNHGMAMLGLLELLAANNVSEKEMYQVALRVNSVWFPQTYLDLATYFKEQGTEWKDVDAKLVLSKDYSSAQGYQQTKQQIQSQPKPAQGGGGCGV